MTATNYVRARDDGRHVELNDGTLIAYMAKREYFDDEHWFVAEGLDSRWHRIVVNAIFGIDGTPSAASLARAINKVF